MLRRGPGSLHLPDQSALPGRNIRPLQLPAGSLGVPGPQQTSDQLQLAPPHLPRPGGPEGAGAVGRALPQHRVRHQDQGQAQEVRRAGPRGELCCPARSGDLPQECIISITASKLASGREDEIKLEI